MAHAVVTPPRSGDAVIDPSVYIQRLIGKNCLAAGNVLVTRCGRVTWLRACAKAEARGDLRWIGRSLEREGWTPETVMAFIIADDALRFWHAFPAGQPWPLSVRKSHINICTEFCEAAAFLQESGMWAKAWIGLLQFRAAIVANAIESRFLSVRESGADYAEAARRLHALQDRMRAGGEFQIGASSPLLEMTLEDLLSRVTCGDTAPEDRARTAGETQKSRGGEEIR